MKFRSPYNHDSDVPSFQAGIDFTDSESMTQQHMRDECDINCMVERFQRTGMPPAQSWESVDFTDVPDYQTALNRIREAQQMFDALPSKMRLEFENNPAKLLAFINDERNRDRAVELGLVEPPPPPPVKAAPEAQNPAPETAPHTTST